MKFKLSTYIIASIASTLALGGCSKSFIERNPYGSIDTDGALTTPSALTSALTATYQTMATSSFFGRDLPIIGDLLADNSYVERKNSGRYLTNFNYSFVVSDGASADIWTNAYKGILRANNIINADVTGDGVDATKAEAYALRGLFYFELVSNFARSYTADSSALGVPLLLEYDPYAKLGRSSVGTVYTQIESDLKAGFASASSFSTSITLSKYAIEGLLAKVYLYEGRYDLAKAAAEDVITNGGFTLVSPSNYANFWATNTPQNSGVEVMFEVDENTTNNNGADDFGGIYNNGYHDIYADSSLYASYSSTDVRKKVLVSGSSKIGSAAITVNKFPNYNNTDKDNIKVLRLAEVYLIAAEAEARLGNTARAQTYLNDLLVQRDASFAGYTSTGDKLIEDIINERRKELAFEGNRFSDLNRLQRTITRLGGNPASIPTGLSTIEYGNIRRILPIPQTEINANSILAGQQNPGY